MENDIDIKCNWYTNKIKLNSANLYFPTFSDIQTDDKINKHFTVTNFTPLQKLNNLSIKNNEPTDISILKDDLQIKLKNKITKLTNNNTIKSMQTKFNRKINNLNNIMYTKKIPLNLCTYQKNIIQTWIKESNNVYNYCVDKFNKNPKDFNLNYMVQKITIFNDLYENCTKNVPYDTLTDIVRAFCSNVKSAYTNLKNKHINHFSIGKKTIKNGYSLFISKKAVSNKGIYVNKLDKIKNFNIDISSIAADARLIYDKNMDKYWLHLPCYKQKTVLCERNKIAALDPGEKIFMTYYSEADYGTIGDNIRIPILEYEKKIRMLQRSLSNNKNKRGNKLNNKKTLKLKIKNYYRKIKNLIKELHNQTALYLCRKYDTILIPKFGTQKMISDKKFDTRNASRNEIKKIIKSGIDISKNLKIYSKKRRLNSRVKFVLQMESHYSFCQHLLLKGQEYGCEIKEVTEEYTSQCCTKCGMLSNIYNNRIKKCKYCKYTIDRDINGSRNIFLKNGNNRISVKAKSRNNEYTNNPFV